MHPSLSLEWTLMFFASLLGVSVMYLLISLAFRKLDLAEAVADRDRLEEECDRLSVRLAKMTRDRDTWKKLHEERDARVQAFLGTLTFPWSEQGS